MEHHCTQKLWSDSRNSIGLSNIDVGQAQSKTLHGASPVLYYTKLNWMIGQYIPALLFTPSNGSNSEQLRTLKSGTNYLSMSPQVRQSSMDELAKK